MNSKRKHLFFIFVISILFLGCLNKQESTNDKSFEEDTQHKKSLPIMHTDKLTGVNINWSFLPKLDQGILDATASLHPKMIRYPGGTISKIWDWESGTSTKGNREAHTLDDLLRLQKATNAKVIFVLNTIQKTLENQLNLLRSARDMGIKIEYIEMGNEHYLGKFQYDLEAFPTGADYAKFVNRWAKAIRKEFPDAKIGISMFSRVSRDERKSAWNESILKNISRENFDAYVYHIYISAQNVGELTAKRVENIIKERTDTYESVKIDDPSKEVWITEYGVRTDTIEKTLLLTNALADYIESHADIALPQVLYTKSDKSFFSMLKAPNANSLSTLGEMFANRWK